MTCQERKDLMLLYVAGALEPGETAELRSHLSRGCPQCAGALAEAETTVHQIPLSLDRIPAPATAWERIESRMALKEQMAPEQTLTDRMALDAPYARRGLPWGAILGWAAAAVMAVTIGLPLYNANVQLAADRGRISTLESEAGRVGPLESTLKVLQAQVNDLKQSEGQHAVQLATAEKRSNDLQQQLDLMMRAESMPVKGDAQADAQGRLFWDKSNGTFTLYVSNAKAAPDGKMYQLWILPQEGAPMPSTVQAHDQAGMLVLKGAIPPTAGALKGAGVTFEPPGGSATPSPPLQFVALLP